MNAPVDVLAVMKDAANAIALYHESFFGKNLGLANELDAARAAVAELIEATAALCNAVEFRIDDPRNALRDRVVMAVTDAGGAK